MTSTYRRQKPPPSGPGWVYFLTCPDFPGCCKIGGTSRTPTHRALELVTQYRTTSGFTVEAQHAVADWWRVEQTTHRMLSDRRLPRSELFRCSPAEASSVIAAAAQAHAQPFAFPAWLRRLQLPSPPRFPAARPAFRSWPGGSRGRRRRDPLRIMLLLLGLVVLWFALRQPLSPGVLGPLHAGAVHPGGRVRVFYP